MVSVDLLIIWVEVGGDIFDIVFWYFLRDVVVFFGVVVEVGGFIFVVDMLMKSWFVVGWEGGYYGVVGSEKS